MFNLFIILASILVSYCIFDYMLHRYIERSFREVEGEDFNREAEDRDDS